jgi:hypothetical protein
MRRLWKKIKQSKAFKRDWGWKAALGRPSGQAETCLVKTTTTTKRH